MKEIWKDISTHIGEYKISSFGRVTSLRAVKTGRILTITISHGRCYIPLFRGTKYILHSVARLVAIHFIPNPENKPCVNHIDFDPLNNHVENLEWATHQENHVYSTIRGRRVNKLAIPKVLRIVKLYQNGWSSARLALKYGVSRTGIKYILKGKTHSWLTGIPKGTKLIRRKQYSIL